MWGKVGKGSVALLGDFFNSRELSKKNLGYKLTKSFKVVTSVISVLVY